MPAVPKPVRVERIKKPLRPSYADATPEQLANARRAQDIIRARAIAKARAKGFTPRKEIPKLNVRAAARRNANYRTVLASDFHKKLRYDAFLRSGGLCECDRCAEIRAAIIPENTFTLSWGFGDQRFADTRWTRAEVALAFALIPVWFTKGGADPWKRFRSTEGELHHDSYKYFGDENPAELDVVRWVWKCCHQRIEREHGTRRRFLKGVK